MKMTRPCLLILVMCLFAGVALADEPAQPPVEAPKPPVEPTDADRSAATRKAIVTRKLSIDVVNVPLVEVLEMLTAQAGVGLSLDGKISDKVLRAPLSLKLRGSSVYAVLHWVFRKRKLTWVVDGPEILVAPAEGIKPDLRTRQEAFAHKTEKRWRDVATPKLAETRMSLNMVRVPLVRLLDLVAERAGVNVVWEEAAERERGRRITLNVEKMPIREIIDKLTAQAKLEWSLEAEAVVISTNRKLEEPPRNPG